MSQFFKSEQVQTDLHSIFETYQEVANKTSQLPGMSLKEKLQHIEECKGLIDRQKTFYTRLCLAASTDPEAADMKQRINALCNAFGYPSLLQCMESMVETLDKAAQKEIDRT